MSAYATSFFPPSASANPTTPSNGHHDNASFDTSCAKPLHKELGVSHNAHSSVPEIFISVKSASVNPAGFIRSTLLARTGDGNKTGVTRPSSSLSSTGDRTTSATFALDSKSCEESVEHDKVDDGDCSRSRSSDTKSSSALNDEAIQFELAISWAGRKYSATRTLGRLVQLRDDLMRELNSVAARGRTRVRHRYRCKQREEDSSLNEESTLPSLMNVEDSFSATSEASSTAVARDKERLSADGGALPPAVVLIPELPPACTGTSSSCFTATSSTSPASSISQSQQEFSSWSGSFTRIHTALKFYCPAVEIWLSTLLEVLPDPGSSPSLTAFLWEPLNLSAVASGGSCALKKKKETTKKGSDHDLRKSKSLCTLSSISEKDDIEED